MIDKTIIYLTDNSLEEPLASLCRNILVKEAKGIPIISVSQKPIDLGDNICVGEIGKNWISLYTQLLAGLRKAKTKYVSIVEHDCLYTNEHLNWIPPKDDTFYYNLNCWLVQWGGNHPELNGMYSLWFPQPRWALSQLVCNRLMHISAVKEVMELLKIGMDISVGRRWHTEFGVASKQFLKATLAASSGKPIQLQRYLKEYTTKYRAEGFKTINPNLDIRHGSNFTGPKRGKKRRYTIDYWGEFKNVIRG